MSSDEVLKFEDDLRKAEKELENLGKRVCDEKYGGIAWAWIGTAVENVQNAINSAYLMDKH